jgi:hypothetical protein
VRTSGRSIRSIRRARAMSAAEGGGMGRTSGAQHLMLHNRKLNHR